jgi:uncharacterized membrane protein YjjP (DUF1212 family)/outer membrane biosynthesis protein TonB
VNGRPAPRTSVATAGRGIVLALLALVLVALAPIGPVLVGGEAATPAAAATDPSAEPATEPGADPEAPEPAPEVEPEPAPGPDEPAPDPDEEPDPPTAPPVAPETPEPSPDPEVDAPEVDEPEAPDPDDEVDAPLDPDVPEDEAEPAPTVVRPATPPAVRTSPIPLASILVAAAVLAVGIGLAVRAWRTRDDDEEADGFPDADGSPADDAGDPAATRPIGVDRDRAGDVATDVTVPLGAVDDPAARRGPPTTGAAAAITRRLDVTRAPDRPAPTAGSPGADPLLLDLLITLGEAMVDAGDSVGEVSETLERVARVNGVPGVAAVVLPTALIVSVPDGVDVRTEVSAAGTSRLRLDQIDALYRLTDAAERGRVDPREGLARIARIRTMRPPFDRPVRLLGYVVLTVGLGLILRGGLLDLIVAAVLGAGIGAMQLTTERLGKHYRAFLPVVAAFAVSVVVFVLGRAVPELSVFPPLVAPLIALLPGALLTTSVIELSTGHIISGAGRLASGALQLLLLAVGILAGAQLVGVPAAEIATAPTEPLAQIAPWVGVLVFGLGVHLFHGARRDTMRWIVLVLLVAYAGQVVGGWFVGSALSAFVGAMAMTPVAIIAARQPSGPPTLVSFLPGFWLLVPGALGLAGVTQLLDEDQLDGLGSLITTGVTMVGVALGVLLGLAAGAAVADLLGLQRGDPSGPDETRTERVLDAP